MGEINDNERAAWSEADHAKRYRERADSLQQLADMEPPPLACERLLELAGQYRVLADHRRSEDAKRPCFEVSRRAMAAKSHRKNKRRPNSGVREEVRLCNPIIHIHRAYCSGWHPC